MTDTKTTLKHYAAAGYGAVAIATADEDRAIAQIIADFPQRPVYRIAAAGGLTDARTTQNVDERANYQTAFVRAANKEREIIAVLDFQHIIKNAGAYRSLRDALPLVKARGSMLVLIAPHWALPAELEHNLPIMTDALPSREELRASLEVCANSTGTRLDASQSAALLDAATGLTIAQAEDTYALSFARNASYDVATVTEEKLKLVRRGGLLEVCPPAGLATLGGLGRLKAAIEEEVIPSASTALAVSSLLFCGVPGTGKSLTSRVLGDLMGIPVLSCDIARLKGSLVGQSEQNIISVFRTARAIAPVILRFDELEKGVGGYASSAQSDSGVTLGMVGTILTQMQEIRDGSEKVTIVGTCNDYSKLPAELTRRFEMRFFVDLPTAEERREIAEIHLRRHIPDEITLPGLTDARALTVCEATPEWTGAEIEDLVRSAARRMLRGLGFAEALQTAAQEIKPLSQVRAEEILKLRTWGKANLRLANSAETQKPRLSSRQIATAREITPDMVSLDSVRGGNA
jgi:hypothetical protein